MLQAFSDETAHNFQKEIEHCILFQAQGNDFSKIEKMLEILDRRPDEYVRTFCSVLEEDEQSEVVSKYCEPVLSGSTKSVPKTELQLAGQKRTASTAFGNTVSGQ